MNQDYTGDTLTPEGAEHLRKTIEDYWLKLGFMVPTWTVNVPFTSSARSACVAVRSGLKNGWPKAAKPASKPTARAA